MTKAFYCMWASPPEVEDFSKHSLQGGIRANLPEYLPVVSAFHLAVFE
jgi:hypothetical protein